MDEQPAPMISGRTLGELIRDFSVCLSLQREMGVNRLELAPDSVRLMDYWQRGKFYAMPGSTGSGERISSPEVQSGSLKPAHTPHGAGADTTVPESCTYPSESRNSESRNSHPRKSASPMPAGAMQNSFLPAIQGRGIGSAGIFFLCDTSSLDEAQRPDITQGSAGELFLNILKAMKLTVDQVYIISFQPPPSHTTLPDAGWQKQVKNHVFRKMKEMNPRIICSMGEAALQVMLGDSACLSHEEGRFHNMATALFIPTFHPARLIEEPALKRPVWESMKRIMHRVSL